MKKPLLTYLLLTIATIATAQTSRVYAEASVLSSGKWVKVSVENSGIKMLSKSALQSMGFSDLTKIAVYGNGGKALPWANSEERFEDLVQIPVLRVGENILFYAEGIETWEYSSSAVFKCEVNPRDQHSYYFITDSGSPSAEPVTIDYQSFTADQTVNSYDYRVNYFDRVQNIQKSGRDWWSASFSQSDGAQSYSFSLPEKDANSSASHVSIKCAARVSSTSTYTVSLNENAITTGTISAKSSSSSSGNYYNTSEKHLSVDALSGTTTVTLNINFSSGTDLGWLGYISIISRTPLKLSTSELLFRNVDTYCSGISRYTISNCTSSTVVWDITTPTNPQKVATSLSGTTLTFNHQNVTGSEFVAFNTNGTFDEPTIVGAIENQNLHALENVEYAIICHPDFLAQAEDLANLHRSLSNLNVAVVTTEQVYNEFSSGKTDICAIRDFLKMLYDRGGLRFALLFGNGTYDNFASDDRQRIPAYESEESVSISNTYATDDFFGWLDDDEGASDLKAKMDIAVGRFPVTNTDEADAVVDKVRIYLTELEEGSWKNRIVYAADDSDDNEHLSYADRAAVAMEKLYEDKNFVKIYLEAYASESTSTGITYPQAVKDFENSFNNGSLVINYFGHGGATAFGDNRLFNQSYIDDYTNLTKLPLVVGATCDFQPYDNNGKTSSGEQMMLHPYGGSIATFSTTREVYSNSNYQIVKAMNDKILTRKDDGSPYTIGEAIEYAKQQTSTLVNSLKYVYLGDPALSLAGFADLNVRTDSINGEDYEYVPLVSALQRTKISASIRDEDNNIDETFNGTASILLYDKKQTRKTTGVKSDVTSFDEYCNTLYNGLVDVENGRFTVDFILSKDIDLEEGYGRISYYAWSDDGRNASSASNEILIGGINLTDEVDTIGPAITMWIDYPEFKDGGVTGSNPILYATLEDVSGINTSSAGVGHNISLWIDEDRENAINLNDFFLYDTNSSTRGSLTYATQLDDGDHTLELKAWDNMNNSSSMIMAVDANSASKIRFGKTELYPQPLKDQPLKLKFSHNDGGSVFTMQLSVYSSTGQLFTRTETTLIASQTQTDEIILTDIMPEIRTFAHGIYFLRVEITSNSGRKGNFSKKLLIATQ